MKQVIAMDELGTRKDVELAQKLSQAGVSFLATAHASSIASLIQNPDLNGLVGGTQQVILGDEKARWEEGVMFFVSCSPAVPMKDRMP